MKPGSMTNRPPSSARSHRYFTKALSKSCPARSRFRFYPRRSPLPGRAQPDVTTHITGSGGLCSGRFIEVLRQASFNRSGIWSGRFRMAWLTPNEFGACYTKHVKTCWSGASVAGGTVVRAELENRPVKEAENRRERSKAMFDTEYPHLAAWILGGDAWIELGMDEVSDSIVRILESAAWSGRATRTTTRWPKPWPTRRRPWLIPGSSIYFEIVFPG